MTEPVRHVFSTVRVVPDPASGEFANLAAIAGSDVTGEWSIRGLQNERRARQFAGAEAIIAAHDFVARVGMTLDLVDWTTLDEIDEADLDPADFQEVTEAWLADLASRNRHVVQLSEPRPIMAESAEEALDFVFANMFHEPERHRRRLTKWTLLSRIFSSLVEVGLEPGENFARRVPLLANGPHKFQHPLDFVVAEKSAVQLVQTWSFQVASQNVLSRDVKAWGWTIRELREHGGSVRAFNNWLNVASDIPIEVVLAKPDDAQATDRYEEALAVLDELDVTVRQFGEEHEVARDAAELLGAF